MGVRVHELRPQSPGKCAKASLVLMVSVAPIVLSDILGSLFGSGRNHSVFTSRCTVLWDIVGRLFLSGGDIVPGGPLHNQLGGLVLLSVPCTLMLSAVGAVLAMIEWRAARKASRRPSRMTVVSARGNIALLIIGISLVAHFFLTFRIL